MATSLVVSCGENELPSIGSEIVIGERTKFVQITSIFELHSLTLYLPMTL